MLTGGDTRGNPFVWFKVALAKINRFPSENDLNQSSQPASKCQRNSSSRKSLFVFLMRVEKTSEACGEVSLSA